MGEADVVVAPGPDAARTSGGESGDPTPAPAKELQEKLRPVLDALPAKNREEVGREIVSVAMSVVEEYSGNIIHPRIARGWEELCPGAANRLLTMTEIEEQHRIWWERSAMESGARFQYLGLAFAFLVSLSLIAGAIYCASIGQPWVSAAFLATSAVGMVRAFLDIRSQGKRAHDEEPARSETVMQKPPVLTQAKKQTKPRP